MEGAIIGGKYKLGKAIGSGAFGMVRIATDIQNTCEVAVKIYVREMIKIKKMEEFVYREIEILNLLRHPNIIRLYEVIDTPEEIYFVMEYAEKGDLFNYISDKGSLQEEEARKIFQQIIFGVEHCHEHNVAHRDLKPENLLLDSELNVKITDFGMSNIMSPGPGFTTKCGSLQYVAPEVITAEFYKGPQADIWSCGIILHALLCGKFPAFDNVGTFTLPRHLSPHLSPTARDLISKMLTVNPMERIEIPMIRKHQWFQAHLP